MPASLSDHFLVSVARDLRALAKCEADDPSASGYLSAPMMLVASIHLGNLTSESNVTISERALYRSLHLYQGAVEREIIKRLVGIGSPNEDIVLLDELEKVRLEDDETWDAASNFG